MFNFRELEVIEKEFKSGNFLGDEVKYTSIIEMKRDLIELLEVIDISDVFRELNKRDNYRVIQCDDSYPVYVETELYKNLDRRSAINITKRLNDKVFDYECENDCNLGIHYTIRYIDRYGEEMTLYLN